MKHGASRLTKRLSLGEEVLGEVYEKISYIDAIKKTFELSSKFTPAALDRLTQSVLVTSTGASNRIEGNQLSDEEVNKLYRNLNIKSFKTRDEQEVAGYIQTLENIFKAPEEFQITERFILQLHRDSLIHSQKDEGHRGGYKTGPNRVEARDAQGNVVKVIFDPTPPHLVKKEMQELTAWYAWAFKNSLKHPLILISNFTFEYLAIHPFQDGNGRTSRLLTNLMLLQNGYKFAKIVSSEKLVEANKAEYYLALNKTQKTWKKKKENIVPWLQFSLDVFEQQAKEAERLMEQDQFEDTLSVKQLEFWEWAKDAEEFSRKDVVEQLGLPTRTAESIIKKFFDESRLDKLGQGRATRYRIK